MKDAEKTRDQLIKELRELRQQIEVMSGGVQSDLDVEDDSVRTLDNIIVQSMPGVFYIIEKSSARIIRRNANWSKITGFSEDELDQMTALDVVVDSDLCARRMQEVYDFGTSSMENLLRTRSGEHIPYYFTGERFTVDGKMYLVGVGLDISEKKQAEKDLQESEEKYRTYIENAPHGIFVVDSNGKYIDVNRAACSMTGYSREELLSISIPDLTIPESLSRTFEIFNELKRSGKVQTEIILRRKDGTSFYSSLEAVSLSNNTFMAFCFDITEHKKAEEELQQSEEKYRDLVENANEAIIVAQDGILKFFNPKTMGFTGYSADELASIPFVQLIHPDDREMVVERHIKRIKGEEVPVTYSFRILNKNSSIRWVDINAALINWEGRSATLNFMNDITERKQAAAALQESEERWRSLVEYSPDHILTVDENLIIRYANFPSPGLTMEELVGTPIYKYVEEQRQSVIKALLENVLKKCESARYETKYITPDGAIIQYETHAAPRMSDGNAIGLTLSARDITERKRMEEELQKVEKLESIGILAGGIAHDLNNFLTGIVGNISLAMMYSDPNEKDRRLAEAEKACMQVKDLTQQLLTFSKGGTPILQTANIENLLRDSATFTLRGSNVICEFAIPDDLWPVEIDENQIGQVINNLIINSQQAMPNGGAITINAENMEIKNPSALSLNPGKYIKVSVRDQGTGIPQDHLQKIFDPFFTTKQTGNGLGLATAFSIIEKHNGHMAVESQMGVGTIFYIYLPASPKGAAVKVKNAEKKPIIGEGRVLVMDDEKHVRDTAASMLDGIGYKVVTAIDGAEAIEMYKEAMASGNPFDAIIMDLTIPGGMGGKEAIQKLMEIDPEVKAIVSSGYSGDPILANFSKHGFRGFIPKPYKMQELSEVLHRVITSIN